MHEKTHLRYLENPLSSFQRRVWFLEHLYPFQPTYNLCLLLRITGPLLVPALERSWREIVRRHSALRTTLPSSNGLAVQRVEVDAHIPMRVEWMTTSFSALGESVVSKRAGQEACHIFDLESGPLWRALLTVLSPSQHALVVTAHHAVCDESSWQVFVEELVALYPVFAAGRMPPRCSSDGQDTQLAAREQSFARTAEMRRQLDFWRSRLGNFEPVAIPLGTDARAEPGPGPGAVVASVLSPALVAQVRAVARRGRTTPFVVMCAAFAVLLSRLSGSSDVAFTVPFANRRDLDAESVIAFLTNTLVLRINVDDDRTAGELLAIAQEVVLDAQENGDAPFDAVLRELRSASGRAEPLPVQVMLNHHPVLPRSLNIGELTVHVREVHTGTAKFPLTLSLEDGADEIRMTLEYRTDCFEGGFAEALLGRFVAVLSALVADPGRLVGELDGLAEGERDRLLGQWNDTAVPVPPVTAAQLVARQVAQCPDAVAVVDDGSRLTYRELDAAAERVAVALRGLGVGPEQVVAVCLPRSCALLAAWLGVWKAGGAWLPLDPEHPDARLAYLLGDAGVRAVVTDRVGAGRIAAAGPALPVVLVDDPHAGMATGSVARAPLDAAPGNLAYLMYTSGSTGNPKGVEITHHNLTNYLVWCMTAYASPRGTGVPAHSSPAYDLAITSLLLPLLVGETVYVVSDEERSSSIGSALAGTNGQVSFVKLTPTDLRSLASGLPHGPHHADRLIVGGEALNYEQVSAWRSGIRWLVNEYGPTEATVGCCVFEVSLGEAPQAGRVPIGRPIANTRMYVLDQRRRLAPAGVAGELYIAGAGVARGYRGRPDLTAQRFLPDPFVPDGRMYRTGDRARWRPDGTLEYLGRLDSQVKIHGVRVEPGEIESVLAGHPAVGEAAVTAVHTPDGRTTLVAYVVPAAGTPLPEPQLRGWLSDRLPTPLVPARYVSVPALPRTSNNKLDRRALPPPPPLPTPPARDHQQPATATEAKLAAIWAEVLGVAHVDPDDNFFDLGGDSILSIQIVSRARRAGLHFRPRQLFQHQTVQELAAVASEPMQAVGADDSGEGLLPFTPIEHWFFERALPNPHHWNQALLLRPRRRLNVHLLRQALCAVVAHHDALRLRFKPAAGRWEKWTTPAEAVEVTLQHIGLDGADWDTWASTSAELEGLQGGFDLDRGPLLRAAFADGGGPPRDRLLLVIHHLAVDTVSWGILLEDLQLALSRLSAGGSAELPPVSTPYPQWARLLDARMRGAPAPSIRPPINGPLYPSAPMDDPDRNLVETADTFHAWIDELLTHRLLLDVPRAFRIPVHACLVAALGRALHTWPDSSMRVIDVESHGRDDSGDGADLCRTVGWLTVFLPVMFRSTPADPPVDWLKEADFLLRDLPRRGLDDFVRRYPRDRPDGRRHRPPLPRPVRFNYHGRQDLFLARSNWFEIASGELGPLRAPAGRRTHLLELDAEVSDERLALTWTYSRELQQRESVVDLSQRMAAVLAELADSARPGAYPRAESASSGFDLLPGELQQALAEFKGKSHQDDR